MKTGEQDLIDRMLNRDRRALSQFYKTYTPKLSVHIRGKVENPQDGDEILSDTLYAFLESLRDFSGKSSLSTYLYSICNHKIIDYYRRKKIKHFVFSRLPQLEALVSPLMGPEDVYDAGILAGKIRKAFSRILPKYRSVLVSKYGEDLSVSEISQKFSVSLKSTEAMLSRARKAFVNAFTTI